jgi:hypothetical protein
MPATMIDEGAEIRRRQALRGPPSAAPLTAAELAEETPLARVLGLDGAEGADAVVFPLGSGKE